MKSRMNDEYLCFVCGRMACGLAVGTPKKLAWYCNECTPQIVQEAIMSNLNVFEQRACKAVADKCGDDTITLNKSEMEDFVRWAVTEFGNALRKDLQGGDPPF